MNRKIFDVREVARLGVVVLIVGLVSLTILSFAHADDEEWRGLHEEVLAGRITPLTDILDRLASQYVGQVVDVDLENNDGARYYEVELLGPQGQLVEFEVDAVTGELIGIKGNNVDGMRRQ